MKFETHILQKPLSEHIESIFHYKGFAPDHAMERVVPTGHIFILFELDGMPRNTFDNETLKPNGTYSKVWVSGMHKNHLSISAHQNSEMLVIQFKPAGAFPFFHLPVNQLNDKVILGEKIFGNKMLQLRQQILEQKTSAKKFKAAENWLLKRMDYDSTPNKELLKIVGLLKDKPFSDHTEIVQLYSKTQKHLIGQFKKYLGLTPKVLHRIFRFNEILQRIHLKEQLDWSQIAYQFGYADQSHFIKEFKEFSGFSPQQFINSEHQKEQTNFFPLDRQG